MDKEKETTYYDSNTGKPLFIAPRGRTFQEFVKESEVKFLRRNLKMSVFSSGI